MCLSILSGQLAVEVCPVIRSPLWGVEQTGNGVSTSLAMDADPGGFSLDGGKDADPEGFFPGQWETNWHRKCEDRPEFWRVNEWGKELAFTENGD